MTFYNNTNKYTQAIYLSPRFALAHFADSELALATGTAASGRMALGGASPAGAGALAGMLLAAGLAALLVIADQLIESWTDGHLLAGWVALWTVAFAILAVLAPRLRRLSALFAGRCIRQIAHMHALREEARMWELASHDPRVLEEIHAAMARQTQ